VTVLAAPCELCGKPTTAKSGLCRRAGECKNEFARRERRARVSGPPRTCYVCGHPLSSSNKTGVCARRNPACLTERSRLWREGATFELTEDRKAAQREYFAGLSTERRQQRNAQERARYARNVASGMLTAAKRQRKRGIPVTITAADIWIPDDCPVCEVPLAVGSGASSDRSPSLDRYDPPLGYVPGNIMVICRGCNRRKQNHTGEQLIQLGLAVIAAKAAYDARFADLLGGEPLLFGGESDEVREHYRRLVECAIARLPESAQCALAA